MKDRINIKQDHAMMKIAEFTHTKPIRLRNGNGYMFVYERMDSYSFAIVDGQIINPECFYTLLAEYNPIVIPAVNDDVISEACANIG
jgi:hypothetical protein